MSSIDLAPTTAPPIEGLLARQIDAAVRAYGRRGPMLDGMQSLLALRAIDQRFDALVESARYYGHTAVSAADHCLSSASRMDHGGAVFVAVMLALVLPCMASERLARLTRYFEADPNATHWACRLYGDAALCALLLQDARPALNRLGIVLSGSLTQHQFADEVARHATDPELADDCLRSQVMMGRSPDDFIPRARVALNNTTRGLGRMSSAMLTAIGVSGAIGLDDEIAQHGARYARDAAPTNERDQTYRDTAMALWTARHPRAALDVIVTAPVNIDDTGLRVVALAGHIDGLLPILRELSTQPAPYTPAQLDVLRMAFGDLPPELTLRPGLASDRNRALSGFACARFRELGCAGLRPEDLQGWTPTLLKDALWPLEQIRLRSGRPLHATNALVPAVRVSHPMRAWLYFEHAVMTRRTFALTADDHARRQLAALQMIQDLDGLLGHQ